MKKLLKLLSLKKVTALLLLSLILNNNTTSYTLFHDDYTPEIELCGDIDDNNKRE